MSFIIVVGALIAAAIVFIGLNRWFGRFTAGRTAQLAFKRHHGHRVSELLGSGVAPDPRRGSPWINIRWGTGTASMVSARLHRGRLQAGVRLDDVRLPVEIWHARSGEDAEFDALAGVDRTRAAALIAQLAELDVDSVSSGALGEDVPPILRVQYDDVEELPTRLARIGELLDALAELGVAEVGD
jgi:hypothetical protein